jgi:hypothetical protein
MNLFLLSWCVDECAEWHFDRHVVKMIVELAQLLSAAHWALAGDNAARKQRLSEMQAAGSLYRATHVNHPCAIWVRAHINNYRFTCLLAKALCNEYFYRYGVDKQHRHKTEAIIDHLAALEPEDLLSDSAKADMQQQQQKLVGPHCVTEPPQAMPDECKVDGDAVAAYRRYYCSSQKSHLVSWKRRAPPPWFVADKSAIVAVLGAKKQRLEGEEAEQEEKPVAKKRRQAKND